METRRLAATAIRERILEATLDEVATAGGEAITMQAVAARADVALRTLYNHFTGRDELLAAAFLHHAAQTRADVEALAVPDAGPEEQLRHVVEAYYARYARMGARLSVLLALRGFPDLEEQIRGIRAWRGRLLQQIIERAHEEGTLAMPVPSALALAYTLTSHAGWQTLREGGPEDAAAVTRVAIEALGSALFHR